MKIFLYSIFSLSVFYFFLLWQFPYEALKRSIRDYLEGNLPLQVKIERVSPLFPLDFRIENLRMQSDSVTLQIPDLRIVPNWLGFLSGKTQWGLMAYPSPDRLKGDYESTHQQIRLRVSAKDFEIAATSPKEFSMKVALNGEARLQWTSEDLAKGQGELWFLLHKTQFEARPGYRAPPLITLLDRIRGEIQFQDGVYRLKRLEVSGKDLNQSFQGDWIIFQKGKAEIPDWGFLSPFWGKR